ncbi:diguanylate cyclase [Permianibacter sp. IMCC34836]|uniref:ligand-binding sensor domain-containing diguanylate cyclase n=1 Tax=Permianibacter fluminis TaxID=2738515 RepID=UPI0015576DEC|nr:ligand-binding sensor domain-containing diguanylate cyclase [Permianibacter fluminis]NQD37540.1 diguanylate cyclase [Permianibacter fluminis]
MDRWFCALLFVLGSLLSSSLAAAGSPACPDGFAPRFQRLSLEQGLSQSVVNTITQDADGFLWFGTQDGLNRYDGYGFSVLRRQTDNPNSLPDNHVNVLASEPNGTLWIGTSNGLARKRRGSDAVEQIPAEQLPGEYILSLLSDDQGRLWIGTSQGLAVYEAAQAKIRILIGANARRLPDEHIRSLLMSGPELWIGTARGIYRYQPEQDRFDEQPLLPDRNVTNLVLRADGRIAIGTQNGVLQSRSDGTGIEKLAVTLPTGFVQSLTEDGDGRLWIGTASGVVVQWPDQRECLLARQPSQNDSLSVSDVLSMFRDRSGVMWLGTYAGGVNKWNSQTALFRHYLPLTALPTGAASNTVAAVLRDRQQALWLGTTDSGVMRLDSKGIRHFPLHLPANHPEGGSDSNTGVYSLLEDQHGRIWFGTFGMGLYRFDPGRDSLRQFDSRTDDISTLSSSYVLSMYEDHQGEIWIGTENGLDQLRENADGSLHFRRLGAQLPVEYQAIDTEVVAITEDYEGQLWVGGMGGLVRIGRDRETMTLYQHQENNPQSLTGNSVTAIRLAPDGDIWVATTDGLNRVHRDLDGRYQISRFGVAQGLPPGAIYAVLPGQDGELWLSTSTGLVRFQPAFPNAIIYRSENGLPSDEFNIGAAFLAADGELLFGSLNGAVGYYPQRLPKPSDQAQVVLTGFRKFDQPQSMAFAIQKRPLLQLNSDERVVSFDVAVLDYTAPERNRFRYRVKGLHEQWIPLIGSHTVTLTGLEAGQYQLQVQGAPATGLWSNDILLLDLVVRSPFWTLHTAYGSAIAIAVVVIGLLALTWWRRSRRLLQSRQEAVQELASKYDALELQTSDNTRQLASAREELRKLQLQRDELQRRLLENQYRDPLTGLPSRRMAANLFADYAADPKPRVLILVDADGMGFVNELHGYQAGDRVLAQLGDLLQRVCRQGDEIMRWDSDVFLLVCEIGGLDEARMLAERIRASVLQQAFTLSERKHVDMTCSIGFALWPLRSGVEQEQRWESSLGLAREALTLAKYFSRNAWFGLVANDTLPTEELVNARRELARDWVSRGWLDLVSSLPQPNLLLQEWPKR